MADRRRRYWASSAVTRLVLHDYRIKDEILSLRLSAFSALERHFNAEIAEVRRGLQRITLGSLLIPSNYCAFVAMSFGTVDDM